MKAIWTMRSLLLRFLEQDRFRVKVAGRGCAWAGFVIADCTGAVGVCKISPQVRGLLHYQGAAIANSDCSIVMFLLECIPNQDIKCVYSFVILLLERAM